MMKNELKTFLKPTLRRVIVILLMPEMFYVLE